MAGKYKTLTEKWAAEDAAKAAAKKRSAPPAKKAPEKKSRGILDFMRGGKTERAIKEATSSRKPAKSSRRYT